MYEDAQPLYEKCLRNRKEFLGENHARTMDCMNNLATLLQLQKRYEEAEQLHEECSRKRISILGENHPDSLACLNNLAVLYEG